MVGLGRVGVLVVHRKHHPPARRACERRACERHTHSDGSPSPGRARLGRGLLRLRLRVSPRDAGRMRRRRGLRGRLDPPAARALRERFCAHRGRELHRRNAPLRSRNAVHQRHLRALLLPRVGRPRPLRLTRRGRLDLRGAHRRNVSPRMHAPRRVRLPHLKRLQSGSGMLSAKRVRTGAVPTVGHGRPRSAMRRSARLRGGVHLPCSSGASVRALRARVQPRTPRAVGLRVLAAARSPRGFRRLQLTHRPGDLRCAFFFTASR